MYIVRIPIGPVRIRLFCPGRAHVLNPLKLGSYANVQRNPKEMPDLKEILSEYWGKCFLLIKL